MFLLECFCVGLQDDELLSWQKGMGFLRNNKQLFPFNESHKLEVSSCTSETLFSC